MENYNENGDPQSLSDDDLVLMLKTHHGDHSAEENTAMQEIIYRLKPEVDAVLRHTNIGWHDMEELEQLVFIQVLQKIDQLRDPQAFHGWVKIIARRTALNHRIRSNQKHDVTLSALSPEGVGREWQPEDDPTERPLQRILAGEQEQRLIASLEQMKPVDRQRLRQFYLMNMSLNDIVEAAGGESVLPLGTVKRQLHTARRRLLELMGTEMAN